MTKAKTRKAIKAKFKITGTGKLKRWRCGKRHLLTKKSSRKKSALSKPVTCENSKQTRMYARLIGAN